METLRDIFAAPDDQPPTQAISVVARADPAQVERDYQQLTERRRAAQVARVARQNAATARQVAQAFGRYGRALREDAATKGSPVEQAVCLFLAATCEEQSDDYTRLQDESTRTADRQGSL